ncbi:uncharacterized protein V1518DRAFT_419326 [Limtongia smithiae]|uniref:uncharacterized protein n=1 Tax=Limtongia smithiae TaxID=1125753 RepID=UPI0034CE51B1
MRIRKSFATAFVTIAVIAAYLAFTPSVALPHDKPLHFVFFFLLTTTFYWVVDTTRRRLINATIVICILIGGIGSEFAQALVPTREFDAYDIVANVAGASIALVISALYHKRMLARKRAAKYSALNNHDLETGFAGSSPGGEAVGLSDLSGSSSKADSAAAPAAA